jgi:hypothetical protein
VPDGAVMSSDAWRRKDTVAPERIPFDPRPLATVTTQRYSPSVCYTWVSLQLRDCSAE